MKWLSLFLTLASNTHVKSALINLAGVLGSLLTPMGSRGAWTLFQGENSETHRCFADHITAESSNDWMDKKTGQTHRIWTPKPDHPDNHWLDATKMAALGCFELGSKLAYVEKRDTTKKKAPRVSYH